MIIEQKSFLGGLVCRFEFGQEDFLYTQTVKGSGSSISYRLRYTEIPKQSATLTTPNRRAVRLGLACAFVLWIFGMTQVNESPALKWILCIGVVALCASLKHLAPITLVQFNTSLGRLQILKDTQIDAVLAEFDARRRAFFVAQWDALDFRTAHDYAQKSLRWLHEQGHLTADEFAQRQALLNALPAPGAGTDIGVPTGRLLN